ncbi:peptidylprolyl isomerase [bacterium]|nr:peptidylprolyl isomerase [bacterium]HPF36938.1 peptidylprolyl isomerase [Candidatus Krumholzibacteria bacterium]HRX52684.1 peptidylprolyl isomerase [Candidatus Krumholzibacteria bacterium]
MTRRLLLLALIAVLGVVAAALLTGRKDQAPLAPIDRPEGSLLPAIDDSLFAAAAHILVAHADSEPPVPGVTRTASEAREKALRLFVELSSDQASFEDLARRESDDPDAERSGGYLGILRRGEIPLDFQMVLFNLEPGQIHPAFESPAGWHVIKRLPIRIAAARHILVTWDGAAGSRVKSGRTRNQAELLAQEIVLECRRPGADFCDLAARYSDDAGTRFECGDLGVMVPGMADPDFEDALFRLRAGDISDPVESVYGFHIILRLE